MNDSKIDILLQTIKAKHEYLYRFIKKRIGNDADTEDILQETLRKALESYDPQRHDKKLLPWIITIAKNNIYNYYKSNKKTESLDDHTEIPAPLDETVLEVYLLSLLKSDFNVPDELLKYLFLSVVKGVPLTEISEKTNIPYTKLRYWKDKFLKEFKQKFEDEKFY